MCLLAEVMSINMHAERLHHVICLSLSRCLCMIISVGGSVQMLYVPRKKEAVPHYTKVYIHISKYT